MRTATALALLLMLPVVAFAAQVNINTATATQLDTLPGIGPAKAAAIVNYRAAHGPFKTTADIQNVKGIGPVTYKNMESMITVGAESATTVATAPSAQLSPPPTSYTRVQAAGPVTSTKQSPPTHEDAIGAPTAVVEPAAVGAVSGPFHSVWMYGLLGVIMVAGGAFVLL